MPVKVRLRRKSEKGLPYKIVEVSGGRVVGQSDSRKKAEASARARNAAHRSKR